MTYITYHSPSICPLLGSEERKERQEGKSLESHFFVWLLVVVHKKFCKVQVNNVCMSPGRVQSILQIFHLHRRIFPQWIPPRQWTPGRPPRASHCSPWRSSILWEQFITACPKIASFLPLPPLIIPWRLAAKRISPLHPIGRRVIQSGGRRRSRIGDSSTSRYISPPVMEENSVR